MADINVTIVARGAIMYKLHLIVWSDNVNATFGQLRSRNLHTNTVVSFTHLMFGVFWIDGEPHDVSMEYITLHEAESEFNISSLTCRENWQNSTNITAACQ
jgi:hypothetical protein